jgi:hypothetical protein
MLQPKTYPTMLGKALVFEADPFIVMIDDDEPWQEGLFMTVLVGFLIGLAQWIGGLLMTASLPPSNAVLALILQAFRTAGFSPDTAARIEGVVNNGWHWLGFFSGYGSGWAGLWMLIGVPLFLVLQWLLFGLIGHMVAKGMGGVGALDQTLGAMALMVAPQALLLFRVIPFVSVSGALLFVWSLLVAYRAMEVAHQLPWRRAAWATVIPALVILVLAGATGVFITAMILRGI